MAWLGKARHGAAWQGSAWQAGRGLAWRGVAWCGEARHGVAGVAGQGGAWQGSARLGSAWQAGQGRARHGEAWRGGAWQGTAGIYSWSFFSVFIMEVYIMAMAYQPKTYSWRVDNMPVDAQTAGEYIEALERASGKVSAQELLDISRSPHATLHECFEWDNNVAAEKYRLGQARYIIGNLVVTVSKPDQAPAAPVRAFVSIEPLKHKGTFVSVDIGMSNPEYSAQILQNAKAELVAFRKKYATFNELANVFKVIDQFLESDQ